MSIFRMGNITILYLKFKLLDHNNDFIAVDGKSITPLTETMAYPFSDLVPLAVLEQE